MAPNRSQRPKFTQIGAAGLNIWSGRVFEEWLPELQGERGRKVLREMSEQDPTIGGILFAIEQLVRQVQWTWVPADESPQAKDIATFFQQAQNDMQPHWADTLSEILSMLPYGWSFFEIVYKYRQGYTDDPMSSSKFDDGKVGWRTWSVRAQDTLYSWDYDEKGQRLISMTQMPPPTYNMFTIPLSKSLHFRTKSRKNNPEGVSVLRSAYRPWYFKKHIESIEGIGIERDLAGLPVMWVPPNLLASTATTEETTLLTELKKIVTNIRRDDQEGILMPLVYDDSGNPMYKLELISTGGQRQFDTDKIINRYDQRIAMTMMADFVLMGHEQVGSFALSDNKTTLFATALGAWLDTIAATITTFEAPRLARLNGFPMGLVPTLSHSDIENADLGKLGTYLQALAAAGMTLFPNPDIEKHLLVQAGIPVPDELASENPDVSAPDNGSAPPDDGGGAAPDDLADNADHEQDDRTGDIAAEIGLAEFSEEFDEFGPETYADHPKFVFGRLNKNYHAAAGKTKQDEATRKKTKSAMLIALRAMRSAGKNHGPAWQKARKEFLATETLSERKARYEKIQAKLADMKKKGVTKTVNGRSVAEMSRYIAGRQKKVEVRTQARVTKSRLHAKKLTLLRPKKPVKTAVRKKIGTATGRAKMTPATLRARRRTSVAGAQERLHGDVRRGHGNTMKASEPEKFFNPIHDRAGRFGTDFGVQQRTGSILRKAGLKQHGGQAAAIRVLHAKGHKPADIARQLGIRPQAVHGALKKIRQAPSRTPGMAGSATRARAKVLTSHGGKPVVTAVSGHRVQAGLHRVGHPERIAAKAPVRTSHGGPARHARVPGQGIQTQRAPGHALRMLKAQQAAKGSLGLRPRTPVGHQSHPSSHGAPKAKAKIVAPPGTVPSPSTARRAAKFKQRGEDVQAVNDRRAGTATLKRVKEGTPRAVPGSLAAKAAANRRLARKDAVANANAAQAAKAAMPAQGGNRKLLGKNGEATPEAMEAHLKVVEGTGAGRLSGPISDLTPLWGGINGAYKGKIGTETVIVKTGASFDKAYHRHGSVRAGEITAGNDHGREAAGSVMAKRMGVEAPTVHVINHLDVAPGPHGVAKGDYGVVMSYVKGKEAMHAQGWQEDIRKRQELGVFDAVIGNTDRHAGNFMVKDSSGKVVPIDHGLAFPDKRARGTGGLFVAPHAGHPLTSESRRILNDLHRDRDAVRGEMEPLIGKKATDLMFARIDHMRTTGKVLSEGEAYGAGAAHAGGGPKGGAHMTSHGGMAGGLAPWHGAAHPRAPLMGRAAIRQAVGAAAGLPGFGGRTSHGGIGGKGAGVHGKGHWADRNAARAQRAAGHGAKAPAPARQAVPSLVRRRHAQAVMDVNMWGVTFAKRQLGIRFKQKPVINKRGAIGWWVARPGGGWNWVDV